MAAVRLPTFASSQIKFTLSCATTAFAHCRNLGTLCSKSAGSSGENSPYSGLWNDKSLSKNDPVRTSAWVNFSAPWKNGPEPDPSGYSRPSMLFFSIASTIASVAAGRSGSDALWAPKTSGRSLLVKVSAKKAIWARLIAPASVLEGGRRCEGWASARSWATMPDSGIMVPL